MNPIRSTLLLLAAALVPAACATTGVSSLDSEARKAAMRADRAAIAYGVESMEQLRLAATHGQRSLRLVRAAANAPLDRRGDILLRAHRESNTASGYVERSDRYAELAVEREELPEVFPYFYVPMHFFYLPLHLACCES